MASLASPAAAYRTENVVLVIIDGLRYSEGLGDPDHVYVPEMWSLAQEGTIIETFRNDGYTYTSRAVPAIWCGAWTEIHEFQDPDCGGQSNNYTELPTVFEYYRKKLERPPEDCVYVIRGYDCYWKCSFDPDYGPDYWPLYRLEGETDLDVWIEADQVLSTLAPSFMLLSLKDVDILAHTGNWEDYTRAIARADSIVGALWNRLETDPIYAGKTTVFVTNDHGRHTDDWTSHGDGCAGCRTIQLLALGPDFVPGYVSTRPRTLRDITPTIGTLLGFATEDATGSPMHEIILTSTSGQDEDAPTRPVVWEPVIWPNPAGFPVTLRFGTRSPGLTRISVYDTRGRLVAVPFHRFLAAGVHAYTWPADARDGSFFAPGTYFIEITSVMGSRTERVVLMR